MALHLAPFDTTHLADQAETAALEIHMEVSEEQEVVTRFLQTVGQTLDLDRA